MGHVKTGNKVETQLLIGGVPNSQKYTSEVVVVNGSKVTIRLFTKGKFATELPVNANYEFTFYTEDGMYKYSGKIVGYTLTDVPPKGEKVALVELNDDGQKMQRREFFRYDCELPISFKRLNNPTSMDRNSGLIIDLSAGGIKVLSNIVLSKAEKLDFDLTLDGNMLFLEAEVMYIDEIDHDNYKFQYKCKFNNLLDMDKDIIIQYILDIQRNSLKTRKFTK